MAQEETTEFSSPGVLQRQPPPAPAHAPATTFLANSGSPGWAAFSECTSYRAGFPGSPALQRKATQSLHPATPASLPWKQEGLVCTAPLSVKGARVSVSSQHASCTVKAWIWFLDTLVQVSAQSLIQLCDVSQSSYSFCSSAASTLNGTMPTACPPSCRLVWSTWEAHLNQSSSCKHQSSLQPCYSQQNLPFPLILGKMCIELHLSP